MNCDREAGSNYSFSNRIRKFQSFRAPCTQSSIAQIDAMCLTLSLQRTANWASKEAAKKAAKEAVMEADEEKAKARAAKKAAKKARKRAAAQVETCCARFHALSKCICMAEYPKYFN